MLRYLIVNGDDFGYSHGVNRGVVAAHEHGIVTSASLMVRQPAALEAAAYARTRTLDVGLHLDFGEWAFLNDRWEPLRALVNLADAGAVEQAVSAQLSAFRDLVGRNPTHLDSHQNVHMREPVRTIVLRCGLELAIPVRHFSTQIRYLGTFYGQTAEGAPLPEAVSIQALIGLLSGIAPGITELGCHPGYALDLNSSYASEREQEIRTLCDPRIRKTIDRLGLTLISFAKLAKTKK
jgi:predicted glycoside hydrolase/deacetylase ChbG (UPF0249 family)